MFYVVARTICSLFFKILFSYKSYGLQNLPAEGPCIIASNHLSFLDPIAVGLLTHRRVSFMARRDLLDNKIFGLLIRNLETIPLNRNGQDIKAIRQALRLLEQERILCIFPEGRRSPDGNLGKPLQGVEVLAKKSQAKVVPVYLEGTNLALPLNACFIRLKKIRAFVGKPIEPETDKPSGELTKRIWQEMHRLREKARNFETIAECNNFIG
jgi:1-acyl-sn-glycerol-3-phosphate acyltransferase